MKESRQLWAALVIWVAAITLHAQTAPLTNSVTPSGLTAYIINGQANPSLTLNRGVTYVFQVNASFHPFYIKTIPTNGASVGAYNKGVTNNGVQTGNLIFAVPSDAPDLLYYHCGSHLAMGGALNIITPPSPPDGRIVLISITDTGVTMQSLGLSNWTAIPEFSSNLTLNGWATVPNYTNTFANGTNTTSFNRLDPICGPNVFLRVRNQSQ
jgi:hypothetical protein